MQEMQEQEVLPITAQEERELRRVYDSLCCYQRKQQLQRQIEAAAKEDAELEQRLHADQNSKIVIDKARIEQQQQELRVRAQRYQAELQHIHTQPNKVVSCGDVWEMLKTLGAKTSKQEVQEIVWEVDENLDDCVDWEEFKLMFQRNIQDNTGLEPSKLFHLVQFLIFDHNGNGLVSVDETMSMLYARYGRVRMEAKLKELFGAELEETGKEGGEINFAQYSRAVSRTQLQTFYESTQGRLAASKSGGLRLLDTSESARK